ncbi:hypothetical protein CK203_117028 [Vitis vinifera]|uniref:Uncharacterized protein n=1 Tax=Vitis vinifera TaxID=29760 RepID=A0A438CU76_VITVI|nr:hypothetical protein CK203_117028 [Vitis vinifera]
MNQNARDMGRMTSQLNAKGEMYILNDGIDMKAKIAAMARRLEELEIMKMQECPTIPAVREMFGDCNTYNSNWRNHPNFPWKPQPPQYQQPAQASQQASNLEQAMMNLNKVMEDFVEAKKSINAQLSQRIDSVESSLNKKMDEVQNDLSQKIDNLQDSISRFASLNIVQEKENSPSQPYQNSMSIHEMEAKEGEPSQKGEVKEVITLRSGKEVDLPTCKLEHKRTTEDSHQGRIDEETHASTFSPSFVWENHTNQVSSFWMIKIRRNCKRNEGKSFGARKVQKQGKNRGLRDFAASAKSALCCEMISQPQQVRCGIATSLRNSHFAAKPFHSLRALSVKIFAAAKPFLAHECHFAAQ